MPLFKEININEQTTAYFWKITEDLEWLFENIPLTEKSVSRLKTMNSMEHKKGFLAVRMLLQHVGFTDFDLIYDEFGKPHLKSEDGRWKMEESETLNFQLPTSNSLHISISHSHEFSCICKIGRASCRERV